MTSHEIMGKQRLYEYIQFGRDGRDRESRRDVPKDTWEDENQRQEI